MNIKNDKKDVTLVMPKPAEFGSTRQSNALLQLFTNTLKDVYWAEQALVKALPKMEQAVTTAELKTGIGAHLTQTQNHVKRLDELFRICNIPAEAKKCAAMEGLLKEADSIVAETPAGTMTRDAAVILAAQKVEHYEIATYGGLVEFAKTLGLQQAAGLLNATLDEEKQTDQGLTLLAQTGINWAAEHEAVSQMNDEK